MACQWTYEIHDNKGITVFRDGAMFSSRKHHNNETLQINAIKTVHYLFDLGMHMIDDVPIEEGTLIANMIASAVKNLVGTISEPEQ